MICPDGYMVSCYDGYKAFWLCGYGVDSSAGVGVTALAGSANAGESGGHHKARCSKHEVNVTLSNKDISPDRLCRVHIQK